VVVREIALSIGNVVIGLVLQIADSATGTGTANVHLVATVNAIADSVAIVIAIADSVAIVIAIADLVGIASREGIAIAVIGNRASKGAGAIPLRARPQGTTTRTAVGMIAAGMIAEKIVDGMIAEGMIGEMTAEGRIGEMIAEGRIGEMIAEGRIGEMIAEGMIGEMIAEGRIGEMNAEGMIGEMNAEGMIGEMIGEMNAEAVTEKMGGAPRRIKRGAETDLRNRHHLANQVSIARDPGRNQETRMKSGSIRIGS